ncbi:MAG: hypothetical protein IPK11_09585 [Ignavibacteria bacterium]|nr:hypothetical protein [Ignavibacteria bacterium]
MDTILTHYRQFPQHSDALKGLMFNPCGVPDHTNLKTINWTTTFNNDYTSGSSTVSKASWFDADRGTDGNFMCTGTHSILSTGAISALNGVVRKYDGFNECGNYPYNLPR